MLHHTAQVPARDAFVATAVSNDALSATPDDAPLSGVSNARLAGVVRGFLAEFSPDKTNDRPTSVHVVLAPGRVNLIGEHIDYEGYSVLPMAIAQTMGVAVASHSGSSPPPNGLSLRIANTDPVFPTTTITLASRVDVSGDALFQQLTASLTTDTAWVRYVLGGYMAVVEWAPTLLSIAVAVDILVDGRVPTACGLSSSSALVVASALALASFVSDGGALPTRTQLAERCRIAEQYVGTAGGGMDQAVSCLATENAALFVAFEPTLHVEPVAFPSTFQKREAVFVVVNSGVEAHKAQDAAARFNKRVIECALATKLLGKRLGVSGREKMTTLSELQRALEEDRGRAVTCDELLELVAEIQDKDEYLREDIATELGCALTSLEALFAGSRLEKAATEVLQIESCFKLWQRARHVWSEAGRVEQFRQLLTVSEINDDVQLQQLGALMFASHESCRGDYECSCPELDRIVATAEKAGAYGARLTGAGWGGCAVLLVPTGRVASLRATLDSEVFEQNTPRGAVFESTAGDGTQLFTVNL